MKVAESLCCEVRTFCEASFAQRPHFVINDVGCGVDESLLVVDAAALNVVVQLAACLRFLGRGRRA